MRQGSYHVFVRSLSLPLVVIGSLLFPLSTSYAAPVTLFTNLSGPAESPPNNSPGTGQATVVLDPTAHTMHLDVTFGGLVGTTTASHIHCCFGINVAANTASVAT